MSRERVVLLGTRVATAVQDLACLCEGTTPESMVFADLHLWNLQELILLTSRVQS